MSNLIELVADAGATTVRRIWSAKIGIGILWVLGIFLIMLRTEIMLLSPWIHAHLKQCVKAWNDIYDVCYPIFQSLTLDMQVLKSLKRLLKGKPLTFNWPTSSAHLRKIFIDDFIEIFDTIPMMCHHRGTAGEIIRGIWYRVLSPRTCMLLRAVYPTPLRNISQSVLGWTVGDRSKNLPPFPASGSSGTCEPESADMSWFCVVFGSGALIVEVVVPLIIAVIVLVSWVPVIARLATLAIRPLNDLSNLI